MQLCCCVTATSGAESPQLHDATLPHKKMTTHQSRLSFRNAVFAAISTDSDRWPQPVIYAEQVEGDKYRFDACNAPAMPSGAIPWMFVEGDSFGDLTGDHESDADGIEDNMFELAVNDVNDEFVRCYAAR